MLGICKINSRYAAMQVEYIHFITLLNQHAYFSATLHRCHPILCPYTVFMTHSCQVGLSQEHISYLGPVI